MSDFSHEGFSLHPELRDKRKPVSTEWLKGPKITAENLRKGTGCVELLARPEWIKDPADQSVQGSMRNVGQSRSGGAPQKSVQNAAVFTFGKHRGKLFVDVLEEDPRYLSWAAQEIPNFREKLVKAGINPDEI